METAFLISFTLGVVKGTFVYFVLMDILIHPFIAGGDSIHHSGLQLSLIKILMKSITFDNLLYLKSNLRIIKQTFYTFLEQYQFALFITL